MILLASLQYLMYSLDASMQLTVQVLVKLIDVLVLEYVIVMEYVIGT